jgi:hypothetical protein
LYLLTPTEEWTQVDDDEEGGRLIDPIEWIGENEKFSVNITDAELNTLMDDSKEIRFEKLSERCLPQLGDSNESLFEFQAARMRNGGWLDAQVLHREQSDYS